MSIQDLIHKQILSHRKKIDQWFLDESDGLFFPFYSSFDIRDSAFKIAPVDANIFPAGFNNICPTDQETSVETVRRYFETHYQGQIKRVALLTEEHTQNPYYWDNVNALERLLKGAGLEVRLALPRHLAEPLRITSASGAEMEVFGGERVGDGVLVDGLQAQLIISNNDFSEAYQEWIQGLSTPINPPHELGWHRRRKDEFFLEYNRLAGMFCHLIGLDPWILQVVTERFQNFDVNDEGSRSRLAEAVDSVLARIRSEQEQHGQDADPFVFIKNNSGTYGLGVLKVDSGEEVRNWSYKARKKMKAAKGGRKIEEVIIQEGIPTTVTSAGATAEPAIYMIGCQLSGGFLRTHSEKSAQESLNSPGAVFKRLCVSDLSISVEGHPLENVYGWVARLGFLAIAHEAKAHNIQAPGFRVCFADRT